MTKGPNWYRKRVPWKNLTTKLQIDTQAILTKDIRNWLPKSKRCLVQCEGTRARRHPDQDVLIFLYGLRKSDLRFFANTWNTSNFTLVSELDSVRVWQFFFPLIYYNHRPWTIKYIVESRLFCNYPKRCGKVFCIPPLEIILYPAIIPGGVGGYFASRSYPGGNTKIFFVKKF